MPSAVSTSLTSSNKPSTIPATAMPLISPSALLEAHLSQNPPIRPSQRTPAQSQKIDLNTSSLTHTNGSSVVKIGATTIICGVRAEILPVSDIPSYDPKLPLKSTHPESHTPISLYNLLVPNLELSTGCSPLHPATTAPSTQAQTITQRLYSLLLTSHILSSSDLAITSQPETDGTVEIKAFWTLYIDLVCISYGGASSVFDASWLSILAALRDTLLPRASWDIDEKIVRCDSRVSRARRLDVRGYPVPLGFGVVKRETDGKAWVLVDPDSFEEQCCDEAGVVVVDCSGEKRRIVRVEKCGGGVVGVEELKEVLERAGERWKEWERVVKRTEAAARKRGG